ncbi:roadblock/LC7 domain-containing protein [Nocardia sp. alder85J]|uniref:roadblock/LC7 domain-containing protein n=1 Tax=Nocardia sp. alder85J TaxID=2862949 RepID=UPI001CD53410|nr:roadblock/LC7 domain-containing protein [Nocardia sp. alder85J]MCX4098379.1 roadblock/LC7 domain-containing protein [Nocardia sp. alder85J]
MTAELHELGWVLAGLLTPDTRFAVLLSGDGLRIAHAGKISVVNAERFAAAASGLRALGRALGECSGPATGTARQNMIEYDGGMVFVTTVGNGAVLGVSTIRDAEVHIVAHRMNRAAAQLGHQLAGLPRPGWAARIP